MSFKHEEYGNRTELSISISGTSNARFHLEGGAGRKLPSKIAQLPPLNTYVSPMNPQKETLQKGRSLSIYTLYMYLL